MLNLFWNRKINFKYFQLRNLFLVLFLLAFISIITPVNVFASCMMPNLTPAEGLLNNNNYDVYLGRVLGKKMYQQERNTIESSVTFEIKKSKNPKAEKVQTFNFRKVLEYYDPSMVFTTGHHCSTVWSRDSVQNLIVGEEYIIAVDLSSKDIAILPIDSGLYWYNQSSEDILEGLQEVQNVYQSEFINQDFSKEEYDKLKGGIEEDLRKEFFYQNQNLVWREILLSMIVGVLILCGATAWYVYKNKKSD